MTRSVGTPEIRTSSFADLDTSTLYAILALRAHVFVVEQRCFYRDLDGRDTEPATRHMWIEAPDDRTVLAYLRTVRDTDGTTRIGRVVTDRAARGRGLAGRLVRHAVSGVHGPVTADAQAYLKGWYSGLGFVVSGPHFVEDGIEHVPMTAAGGVGARHAEAATGGPA